MARRLLFKENELSLSSNPPSGYNWVGYNGLTFSEKQSDGDIIGIGGQSVSSNWVLLSTVSYVDINQNEGATEFIAGTFSFSSGLVEAIAIKYTQLLDVNTPASFRVENTEGQPFGLNLVANLEQVGNYLVPLTGGYQISDYVVIFRAGTTGSFPVISLTFSSTNTQGEFEIWSKITVL